MKTLLLMLPIIMVNFLMSFNSSAAEPRSEKLDQDAMSNLEQELRLNPASAKKVVPKIEDTIINLLQSKEMKSDFSISVDEKNQLQMLERLSQAKDLKGLKKIVSEHNEKDSALFFMSYLDSPRTTFLNGSCVSFNPPKIDVHTENEMLGDTPTEEGKEKFSVFRFSGKVKFGDYTFIGEGNRTNRLTFTKLSPKSVVIKLGDKEFQWISYSEFAYVRGHGKVYLPGGKAFKFGYNKESTSK